MDDTGDESVEFDVTRVLESDITVYHSPFVVGDLVKVKGSKTTGVVTSARQAGVIVRLDGAQPTELDLTEGDALATLGVL